MKTYLVGGAVRDSLLGLPVIERDWVVVGADRARMLAAGFVPVDGEFPVFRHPETDEEYALARRESKRGPGYRGFDVDAGPGIKLEEDLRRRDLTINAMAQDADGQLIDPFGGREDLELGRLRHVSPAFTEDPVRLLRVARFAAWLGACGFRVAHPTHHLLVEMARGDDLAHLTRERLWHEMYRAMATPQPWRFFEVLHRCGALARLIPALSAAMGAAPAHGDAPDSAPVRALKRIVPRVDAPAPRLAAALCPALDTTEQLTALMQALPADRNTALLLRRCVQGRDDCVRAVAGDPDAALRLLNGWRAFDAAQGFRNSLAVCAAQPGLEALACGLRGARDAAAGVEPGPLQAAGLSGPALGKALRVERRAAIMRCMGATRRDSE